MQTNTTTTAQAALTEKALLVSLNIKQWSAKKFDKKATQEVNDNHGSTDAGRFNKALIAKDHLKEIATVANEARTFHYENTLPWDDNGQRLLPTANYFEYNQSLSLFKSKFDGLVREFCKGYPNMIDEARQRLNGLFNIADYPEAGRIADKFSIKETFMPMPDAQDFRVNLNSQEVEAIRGDIEAEVNSRFAQAHKDIYTRIGSQLKAMHERLSVPDAIFRDSLFENLRELIDLLPRLNIAEDPNITALTAELRAVYADPGQVRTNTMLRSEKAAQVEDILASMTGFLR